MKHQAFKDEAQRELKDTVMPLTAAITRILLSKVYIMAEAYGTIVSVQSGLSYQYCVFSRLSHAAYHLQKDMVLLCYVSFTTLIFVPLS